jgi:transposase
MRRYPLRDDQWDRIKEFLPGREGHVGGTAADNRLFVEAVRFRYGAGVPWRDLPERFADWKVVYQRFNRRAKSGVFERIFKQLPSDHDNEYTMINATIVRAHQHSAVPRCCCAVVPQLRSEFETDFGLSLSFAKRDFQLTDFGDVFNVCATTRDGVTEAMPPPEAGLLGVVRCCDVGTSRDYILQFGVGPVHQVPCYVLDFVAIVSSRVVLQIGGGWIR